MPPRSGFTLMEALLALAIIAILAGLTLPSFAALRARRQLDVQAESLLFAVQLARGEALRSGRPAYLCAANLKIDQELQGCLPDGKGTDWPEGALLYQDKDAAGNGAYDAGERRRLWLFDARRVRVQAEQRQLAFTPEGRLADGVARNFRLNGGGLCRRLMVAGSGRPQLEKAGDACA